MIKLKAMLNEAPNTGERIQNLNNRIKVLRDKISATKSPEQKKLFSDRLKNALQSLSNIKKDHSIKAPHRESVVNEDNTAFETLMLIRNLEQTNKLLAQDLKTSKRLPNDKKENIKKSIVVNQGLINYYKETYKNLKNNESVNEASPCWKGYKQVGMKDKGGRQVPNCVPNESVVKEISSKTPKIFVKTAAVEKKIKELMDDRKKAVVPYNSEKDPKKKEILKQILIKLTKQIQGYEKNLIQLRDMEEEYLQQMHADAELDTTGL